MGGSPSTTRAGGRADQASRKSGEMGIAAIEEDEEEEDVFDDGMEVEEVDQFGPRLVIPLSDPDASAGALGVDAGTDTEPVSPLSPLPSAGLEDFPLDSAPGASSGGVPLTAQALAKMEEEVEEGGGSIKADAGIKGSE